MGTREQEEKRVLDSEAVQNAASDPRELLALRQQVTVTPISKTLCASLMPP